MKKIKHLLLIPALVLTAAGMWGCAGDGGAATGGGGAFEEAFNNPPETTKPWVYWYWISDNISKEGITRDLEAMAEVGIGEALIGNVVDPDVPVGKVKVLSDEWWSCVEHAVKEADRLGIKVGMFNCPGWSQSGGPWVKPEQAMRYLTSSELRVEGPRKITQKLEAPVDNFTQLIVQAFPVPELDGDRIAGGKARISVTNINNVNALFDGNKQTSATITGYPATVSITLDQPYTTRTVELFPAGPVNSSMVLEANDGGNWKQIASRDIARYNLGNAIGPLKLGSIAETYEPVTAAEYRLTFPKGTTKDAKIGELEISGAARLSFYVEKQLGKMSPSPEIFSDTYMWHQSAEPGGDASLVVDDSRIVDITANVDANGVLTWDAPEGEWIVLRTGTGLTGTKNAPTTPQGEGYEIDKMSKEIAAYHFDQYIGELLKRVPAEQRKGFRHVVADSYEQGSQNWTDDLYEDFKSTYGYDPTPWLPVLTGRLVESADRSDRFLWDMRRIVADRIATGYVAGLREKCEENGLRLWLENYGHWGFPGEFLKYGGASHDLGGEFWVSAPELGPVEVRCASSAGHIYNKQVVSAEAFTSHWTFNKTPRDLKTRGDWAWTEGINHFVLHVYIHQPYEQLPGMAAWFGTDFNRYNTWFMSSKSWFDYLRRSCGVLQTGNHVGDIAYFIGEDAPKMTGDRDPALPKGYDYDFINTEVLIDNAKVVDGRIELSSGASYAIMVLPPYTTMRPATLEKIAQLVNDGATILGPAPDHSPSGQDYGTADEQVKKLAAEMWGPIDGSAVKENVYGKGRVLYGMNLTEALGKLGIMQDVIVPDDTFLFTHRRDQGEDAYFLSNQKDGQNNGTFAFRVTGKQPELWNPVTGEIRALTDFTEKDGMTYVPLEFGSGDSWFVVFRKKGKATGEANFPSYKNIATVAAKGSVAFNPAYGALTQTRQFDGFFDWSKDSDPEVKYYSGGGVYTLSFDYDGSTDGPVYIDLGKVEAVATVKLNGQDMGILWRYPYRLDVSSALQQGANQLEVKVENCWWNRLIGDKQPGAKPYTWSSYTKGWDANTPLLESGLLGPVELQVREFAKN